MPAGPPLPLPPARMMSYVGSASGPGVTLEQNYLLVGEKLRELIDAQLPADWDWAGKRVLDFGAGAGRVLRHFADEAEVARFEGCDVDEEMVAWAQANLCPPFAGWSVNDVDPPLPYPDGSFDLVLAFSVFTHLGANWAEWLLEVRRVLAPDGLFIVSFLDESCSRALTTLPYHPDEVGMSVFGFTDPQYVNVLHSEWWLREHWGRAFEFVSFSAGRPHGSQGIAALRPRATTLEPDDLWLEAPGERRYAAAHRHQLALMQLEAEQARQIASRAGSARAMLNLLPPAVLDRLRHLRDRSRRTG